MNDHALFPKHGAPRLNDPRRLETQAGDKDLARLLDLRGDEDLLDLGSGTGFYTDRLAALTSGTVYAIDIQPEMNEAYRERGVPANVRLLLGDITALTLASGSADAAVSLATWHEAKGGLDLPGLTRILRPAGRLVVIDWRRDAEEWEGGPRLEIRSTKEEVAEALAPYFELVSAEDLGRFMLAVVARKRSSADT